MSEKSIAELNFYLFFQIKGFVIVPKDFKETDLPVCTFLPFTLTPTPLKREYFQQILDLQPKINQLIYKIASSPFLLQKALGKY